jgi:hypothetical protein
MGLSLITRLGVCYDHSQTEPALYALGVDIGLVESPFQHTCL